MQDAGGRGQGAGVGNWMPCPGPLHPASRIPFVCYSMTARISLSLISKYSLSPISIVSGA